MAKVRGYPVFSAIVLEFVNKNKAKLEFFGFVSDLERFGFVSVIEMTLFKNSAHLIQLSSRRNIAKLNKGILEAEISCGIPTSFSLISS